jgi:excisionase family DNA binding protein
MEIKIKSDDLLTVPEAAKQLGRPKMTLYRWIKANKIIYAKLGGVSFIPKSEVERLKNERVAESEKSAEKGGVR